jgi:hypothetical protein
MIVSELSTPVSGPPCNWSSTDCGSGLPCASSRLSTPTSRMFCAPPLLPPEMTFVVVMPAVTLR